MFRPRLEDFVDMRDSLVRLANAIDWEGLEEDLSQYYCADNGRPGGCIWLMVGLCILKDKEGLSNEDLYRVWRQNPYFQYFCGEEYFRHDGPVEKDALLAPFFKEALEKANIIYAQSLTPKAKEKLYSWHAPEVECIAKGKSHKRYEFGCKASYVTTNKSNFIIGAMALHGKPYDGHTLEKVLEQVIKLTGIKPTEAHVDLEYKGHGIKDDELEIILFRQKRGITADKQKRQKRRSAIEPIIGHCKNDRKAGPRNWLKGKLGDKINAIAMALGVNIRKILNKIFLRVIQKLIGIFNLFVLRQKIGLFYG
ncbi:MAG: transposase [Alphaproteobacteria bacterium]